ncbi:hypothetical protein [Paenibacillus sp. RUD330]|nr:hypothetical protein [Paenibacillus sp. RUD330]
MTMPDLAKAIQAGQLQMEDVKQVAQTFWKGGGKHGHSVGNKSA